MLYFISLQLLIYTYIKIYNTHKRRELVGVRERQLITRLTHIMDSLAVNRKFVYRHKVDECAGLCGQVEGNNHPL